MCYKVSRFRDEGASMIAWNYLLNLKESDCAAINCHLRYFEVFN